MFTYRATKKKKNTHTHIYTLPDKHFYGSDSFFYVYFHEIISNVYLTKILLKWFIRWEKFQSDILIALKTIHLIRQKKKKQRVKFYKNKQMNALIAEFSLSLEGECLQSFFVFIFFSLAIFNKVFQFDSNIWIGILLIYKG